MNKINIGLWKQTSKDGKIGYYVGYFLNLRIALFDNSEAKKKNEKAPDLRLIVSCNQNNFDKKIKDTEESLNFSPEELEILGNDEIPFEA